MTRELLIGDVPLVGARRAPQAVAASLDGELLTYAELETRTADLAAALRASGVRRGERVIWQAETCFDALGLYFATARIGAMFVPINPRFTSEEAERIIGHADPCLILGDEASGNERIETLLKRAAKDPGPLEAPRETDGHVMFYTSGTTGQSKGCILSQRTQRLRSSEKSVWPRGGELCMFPQFHMSGWHRVLENLIEGNELSFVRRPDAEELMEVTTRRKPRSTYCIPAVWQRIFEKDSSRYDLSSLRVVDTGTSMVTRDLLDGLAKRFPDATTMIVYGSTEVGMATSAGPADGYARANGGVGRPSPGVLCSLSESGELIVDSPYLFSGYFRNEEANAKALIDGCYYTGDVAEQDEEGRYRIIGRVGDLIRTGGEAVAPTEVEEVLLSCPGIAEIAIVGVPDPTWGQIVTAFVVRKPGQEVTLDALRAHCTSRLVPHKHPRRLELVDSLPRTAATNQIQRRKLLEARVMAKPGLLLIYPYMEYMGGLIADRFDLLKTWEEADPDAAIAERGAGVVAILTTGNEPIGADLMNRLPSLKVIVAVGAGYGGIDVRAARERGVTITNAGDTHSGDVADHAIGMILGLVQKLWFNDSYVRTGEWVEKGYPKHRRSMSAERFGIVGLGRIGHAVGDRLVPFMGEIAWWGPNRKDAPWPRLGSPLELAKWCTVLIVAGRGDAGQVVTKEVVDAVGADGYIVNVARGAVIDEEAMIAALCEGRLAGAGLDVFATEPTPPERWAKVPNVILSPHMAGQTIEAMARLREAAATNLKTALDGGAVLNEILA